MSFKEPLVYTLPTVGAITYTAGTTTALGIKATKVGAGSHTAANVSGDGLALSLLSTSEAAAMTITHADVLSFPLNQIERVEFDWKASGLTANSVACIGLGSAYNADEDALTNNFLFKADGSSSIVVETDDNTTDNDDKATGLTLGSSYTHCVIDFSYGLADVRFLSETTRGRRELARTTKFDASGAAGNNVQPYIKCEKASSIDTPILTFKNFKIYYKSN